MAEQEPQDAGLDVVARLLNDQPIGQRHIWFHKVIETAHESIAIINTEGRLIYVNRRLCELSGYPSAELLGRKFYEFQANDPDEGQRRLAERKAGKRESYEVRLRRKDGSLVWVLVNANPILNERGEMVASLGMAFDINARRIAEEALRESEERFRLVVQNSPDLMFHQDTDLRFTWFSKTIPPLRQEDVIGHTDHDVIDSEQARHLVELKKQVIESGVPACVENAVELGGKVHYFESVIVRRVDTGGNVQGIAGYARDVTERKLAEQAVRDANTNLERRVAQRTESLRVSKELARQMAEHNQLLVKELEHRVANNLTGLLGLVGAMRGQSHDVNSFADAIEARLRGMAHVHEMLRRARWNAVDLRELIKSTLKAARDATCFPTEESLEGPRVEVAARFVQALTLVLLELYTNSCKYGAHSVAGGCLAVRWTLVPNPAGPKVQLTWQERGGPPRGGPISPSLGTQLVRLFATNELHGRCELTFPPEGAKHLIEFPADGAGGTPEAPERSKNLAQRSDRRSVLMLT